MQESGGPEITREMAAWFLGILVALLTVLARLKWIGRLLKRFIAWLGRRMILAALNADPKEAREYIAKLFEAEMAESRERDAKNAEDWRMTRALVGELEKTVVAIEDDVRGIRRDMHDERAEMRGDIAVLGVRMERTARDLVKRFEAASDQQSKALGQVADSLVPIRQELHTMSGYVRGAEIFRRRDPDD